MARRYIDERAVSNLKKMYDELAEAGAGRKGGAEIDLDLLFMDVLRAVGLFEMDNFEEVIGIESAVRAVTMVALPEELVIGGRG